MADSSIKIGDRIRKLRLKRELSLEELAKKTTLSPTVLAKIEEHAVSPPLGTMILLAKALQVPLGDIFGDHADSPYCIVRSDDQNSASRFGSTGGRSGYNYKSLGRQKQNRQMEPFLVTLTPTESPLAEPNQHEGEEILFVLEGQVKVQLADHTDILNPGDSIYYDSNLPHVVACHGEQPAKIFAVIYAEKEMLIL